MDGEKIFRYPDKQLSTLFFRDGKKEIDFVLAYEESENEAVKNMREEFQGYLVNQGLEIEVESKAEAFDGKTYFVKIHAPWDVVSKYAEKFNIKMPLKVFQGSQKGRPYFSPNPRYVFSARRQSILAKMKHHNRKHAALNYFYFASKMFCYNKVLIPDEPRYFCVPYRRQCEEHYFGQVDDNYLVSAQRSSIVWEILNDGRRIDTSHDNAVPCEKGITCLLRENVYTAAYPLHDGLRGHGKFRPGLEIFSDRRVLYSEWGRFSCMFKIQPLDRIRRYFGDRTALFFAWMSFYTKMLIPLALIGLFIMCYGVASVEPNIISIEVCDKLGLGNRTMCPICTRYCPYFKLADLCSTTKVHRMFDNEVANIYSSVVVIWAFLFLKLWKREEARLLWRWNLSGHTEQIHDVPKTKFQKDILFTRAVSTVLFSEALCCKIVSSMKDVTITDFNQSYIRRNGLKHCEFQQFLRGIDLEFDDVMYYLAMSGRVEATLLVDVVIALLTYHISVLFALSITEGHKWVEATPLIISAVASTVNVVCVILLDKLYMVIALWLTDFEVRRSQREFESSLITKAFLLQFVNTFTSFIYISFFKGNFRSYPGESETYFGFRQDECEIDSCIIQVSLHLSIFIVCKQIFYSIFAWCYWKVWHEFCVARKLAGIKCKEEKLQAASRWEQDYLLSSYNFKTMFFDEYLELVMQFGLVTLFIVAFPPAPFFALVHNLIKQRMEASKCVTGYRRPVAFTVANIGAWNTVLRFITVFSVITNAFFVSFVSNVVPHQVFKYFYSCDVSEFGYQNFTLSPFKVSDFPPGQAPINPGLPNVTVCWYSGIRKLTKGISSGFLTTEFLLIFSMSLVLVIIWQHVLFGIAAVIFCCIPNIPYDIKKKKLHEKVLDSEALSELIHVKAKCALCISDIQQLEGISETTE